MYVFESFPPDHYMGAWGDKFGRFLLEDHDTGLLGFILNVGNYLSSNI